jgi:uncharacterized repeat protein (TIGR01451 family)
MSPVRGIRRTGRAVATLAAAVAIGVLPAAASPANAASLQLTTPYPGIAVQPGSTASFTITVKTPVAERVSLAVSGVPTGWTAVLHGGGLEIRSVWVDPSTTAPAIGLDVSIPSGASEGTTTIAVTASAGGATATLPLQIVIAQQAGGTVELTTDFPDLKGSSTATFPFTLDLHNNTPNQLVFTLQATGPAGWTVTAVPAGQSQAASLTVPAGSSSSVDVSATPPSNVQAGSYQLNVQAVGPGGRNAQKQLTVEITGKVSMSLTTPDQVLSTQATAGDTKSFIVLVENNGTAPLTNVSLSATAPSGWHVTFDPTSVTSVAPGQNANVTAKIQPSGDAISGDYDITMQASTTDASQSMDVRVTVETSPLWGVVGAVLIIAAIGGLYGVFRRFGRR